MTYSELIGVNIPAEIGYLIKKDNTLDERLVYLLKKWLQPMILLT